MLYPDALVSLGNATAENDAQIGAYSEKSGQAATHGESYGLAEHD